MTRLLIQNFYRIPLLVATVLCAGCTTSLQTVTLENPALTADNTGSFGPRPDIPTPEDIHRLTRAQRDDFLTWMDDPEHADLKANLRMFKYLEKITADFAYEGHTFSATETLSSNSGNCMSLAVLTTALADLAGLEIDYQLMDDIPIFEFNESVIKKGIHIRSKIYDPGIIEEEGVFVLTRPGINIDYFPTNRQRFIGNIDRNDYLAMFYQNLAVESLESGHLDAAYWLAMEALNYVPGDSRAINTLAIVNRRVGDLETAEAIYRFGIAHADNKLTLLKNFQILLESTGRLPEAKAIANRLARMEDPSPFHWFQLARDSQDKGDYRTAIRFYNKALELAPYLHEAWLGIAQANYELGRLDRTRTALTAAVAEAGKVSTRNLYQAKLAVLDGETTRR